ncbi:MAG TPA: hypothetical protein VH370_00665 [Humisphaera sp.]|jgi:plasmid stability protein|nr:hypothetical protein [Humisphaera sp.]
MTLSISLSPEVEAKLRERAAASGRSLDDYASQVLEIAATKPTVDDVLAAFRRQVAESGMNDDALDNFLEDVREKAFQDRKRRPA